MANTRRPRDASLQYWPRKRAGSQRARVRAWAHSKEAKLMGFAGYKAGMTHLIVSDNRPHSKNKGKEMVMPVTIIECPPLKIASAVFYKKNAYGLYPYSQVMNEKLDKELARTITLPKKITKKIEDIKPEEFEAMKVVVYTQPRMTGIGKKKPEIFEVAVGGSKQEQLAFAKDKLGKEIIVTEVFKEGNLVDTHSITIGKGHQGPVKRHGVALKSHKAEKSRRAAVLGPEGYAKVNFKAHQAGQMGYHQRTEYNKWVVKIGSPSDIAPKGGLLHFGKLKNSYILLKGSVGGPKKRLIRINAAIRPNSSVPKDAPKIEYMSNSSQQGA